MNTVLTLSSKNQLTLPVALVKLLQLSKGAKLRTTVVKKSIVIEKVDDSWDSLQGMLAQHPLSKKYTTQEVIELAKKKAAKRIAQKYGV